MHRSGVYDSGPGPLLPVERTRRAEPALRRATAGDHQPTQSHPAVWRAPPCTRVHAAPFRRRECAFANSTPTAFRGPARPARPAVNAHRRPPASPRHDAPQSAVRRGTVDHAAVAHRGLQPDRHRRVPRTGDGAARHLPLDRGRARPGGVWKPHASDLFHQFGESMALIADVSRALNSSRGGIRRISGRARQRLYDRTAGPSVTPRLD